MWWLGWLDSNQRMAESESAALPLGDTPKVFKAYSFLLKNQVLFCQIDISFDKLLAFFYLKIKEFKNV